MKKLISLLAIVSLSACGKGYQSAGQPGSATVDSHSSSSTALPGLRPDTAGAVGGQTSSAILDSLLSEIQNAIANGGSGSETDNLNDSIACPNGGTVTLVGQITASASFNASGASIGLSNGSGSLTFAECKIVDGNGDATVINGTVTLSQLSSSANLMLDITATSSVTSQGMTALSGSLSITSPDYTGTCDINYSANYKTNSSFDATTFGMNGTANATVTGSLCGDSISGQQSFNFSL